MSFIPAKWIPEEEDVHNLELIAQIDGNLQVLRMNPDWARLLEKQARLREAVGSIGVEGTVISIAQARTISEGQSDPSIGEKERREFIGYYDSLQFIKEHSEEELTLGLILRIHEKIVAGDPNALPGKIRTEQNAVKRNGQVIYLPPPASQLDVLLREFIVWFNRTAQESSSPVSAAAICHFWFVWIHPFTDGNGRVGRLLTTFLLLKRQTESIRYFALSDYYNRHQGQYYDALAATNICNPKTPAMSFARDMSPWIRFFISSFLDQSKEIRGITNRILQLNIRVQHLRSDGLITDKQNRVLSLLYSQERASYMELQKHLGDVSAGRITQLLKPLRKAGILIEERIGRTLWFKLGAPEAEPDERALASFKKKLKRKVVDKPSGKAKIASVQRALPIFGETDLENPKA